MPSKKALLSAPPSPPASPPPGRRRTAPHSGSPLCGDPAGRGGCALSGRTRAANAAEEQRETLCARMPSTVPLSAAEFPTHLTPCASPSLRPRARRTRRRRRRWAACGGTRQRAESRHDKRPSQHALRAVLQWREEHWDERMTPHPSIEVTMWMLSCTSGEMSKARSSKKVMMSSLVALKGSPRILSTPVCTSGCRMRRECCWRGSAREGTTAEACECTNV